MEKNMEEDRLRLPFRNNCEGYFTDGKGNVLAKKSDQGHIIFPGGGIDEGESVEEGMKRETIEETGAKVKNIKFLESIKIIWEKDWAKTEKQKKRFTQFQGDKMHFFSGAIAEIKENNKEEDYWEGDKLIPINDVIKIIESNKDADESTRKYRKMQLKFLKEL